MNITFPVQGANQAELNAEADRIARLFFADAKKLSFGVTSIKPLDAEDGGIPKPGAPVIWVGVAMASDDGKERFGQAKADDQDTFNTEAAVAAPVVAPVTP